MSQTASRFQGRFGYAPGLRVGTYPGVGQPAPQAPVTGTQAPPVAFTPTPAYTPSPLAQLLPSTPAPQPQVMAGSLNPDERRGYDGGGAGSSEQGAYGGPGPTGMASTGNFGMDALGFGSAAGRAGMGAIGSGVVGSAFGAMASGLANALGFTETAEDIAGTLGLSGPITGYDPNATTNPAAYGEQAGIGDPKGDPGADPNTPTSYGVDFGLGPESMGQDGAGVGGDNSDNGNSNSTSAGQDASGGNDGSGAGGPGTGAGAPGNDSGDAGEWMRGGYTGAGRDGAVQPAQPAGTVHEGEVVIPAAQVARYGLAPLLRLARGTVEPSALAKLLRG